MYTFKCISKILKTIVSVNEVSYNDSVLTKYSLLRCMHVHIFIHLYIYKFIFKVASKP